MYLHQYVTAQFSLSYYLPLVYGALNIMYTGNDHQKFMLFLALFTFKKIIIMLTYRENNLYKVIIIWLCRIIR